MKDPARDFSKGMVALALMVAVTAMLGTIALGMMFDSEHIPGDLMTNGAYYAFARLGEYYHAGNFFVIAYALTNLVGQFSVMVLSINAPLRMLLESADRTYIPERLLKKNEKGVYVNGQKLIGVIASVLIVVPAFGHPQCGRSGPVAGEGQFRLHAPALSVGLRDLHCPETGRREVSGCVPFRPEQGNRHRHWPVVLCIYGICLSDGNLLGGPLLAGPEYCDALCAGGAWDFVSSAIIPMRGDKPMRRMQNERELTRALLDFLEKSPTSFHAVEQMEARLRKEGFEELREEDFWKLEEGRKCCLIRSMSSLIAFRIPGTDFGGYQIMASHSDSPAFKLKENPEMEAEQHYVKLNVEKYGGMLCAPWFDRPLSIAGRLVIGREGRLVTKLVNVDRDLVMIPSLAIHMNRQVNEGYSYNAQKDMLPSTAETGRRSP